MLKPNNAWCLIRPNLGSEENATPSGIELPYAPVKETVRRGTVVAVGPGNVTSGGARVPLQYAEGEEVAYSGHQAQIVSVANVEHHLVRDTDIYASFEA